jgi:alpha-beta hydrolase superfamily lysophospholipase
MTIPQPAPALPDEATTRMADGTILRTIHWAPDGEPWAVVLIVHGLGEHAGRYGTVAAALTGAGLDVHAYDHRGFGASAGPRAHVERWGILLEDLQERVISLRAANPDLPLVLYGHSMGGLVAAGYVLPDVPRPLPDLLVLSAPGLDADIPGWKRTLASTLTRVAPRMRVSNGPMGEGLSRDPAVREAYARDPLRLGSSTIRFGAEAFAEQARVRDAIEAIDRMPIPTYVFHGSADPIVPVGVTAGLEGKGNVTRRVHDGLQHECHHEPEHEAVLAEVVAWIRANAVPRVRPASDPEVLVGTKAVAV